jgi:uncharacterized protein (TIGR00369 family)
MCSRQAPAALGLEFSVRDDGSVEARFEPEQRFQGYPRMLHGGVTSSLLDAAMTNCLFAGGIVAVTAELNVRFRHPIDLESPMRIRAWVLRSQPPLRVLEAEIRQGASVKARGRGKFMQSEALEGGKSPRP